MKKNVYLVQVNVSYSDRLSYVPYAAGCVAAYAFSKEEIKKDYELREIVFLREPPETVLSRIEEPYFVGFSCYTWNMEYNKALARLIKEKYPSCIISFSGHEVPESTELLEKFPFMDILTFGEGEETFYKLLKAFSDNEELSDIPNIAFRRGSEYIKTPVSFCFKLDDYPSPYTMGLFDKMLEDNPKIQFNTILETNRGCPYGCAYCDWCFTKKVRRFPMEKIKAEIDWMSEKKIAYCYCADANFGIFDRDTEIARYVVEKHNSTGYPAIFKPCYAKNSDDTVFEAGKLLNDAGADKGVTLAYQTLCDEALQNIGRENLTLEHFADLDARYAAADIPTYTELILGMPGETYESFSKGMCRLLESGQHNSMTVYNCQVYCNSPMGQKEYQEKYGIKTTRIPLHGIHYPLNFNGVEEYFNVIIETSSMPKEDWVKANMFSIVLQAFHHLGLLRCFAVYLRKEKNISYFDFYDSLLSYIYSVPETGTYAVIKDMTDRMADTDSGDWTYQKDIFSPIGWYFEEGAFLDMAYRGEEFWEDIMPFIRSFRIEEDIFNELLSYQKAIIRRPGVNEAVIKTRYDFYSYFERIYEDRYEPLEKTDTELQITMEKNITNWAQYAIEIIWYGKRRSATLITNPRETIKLIR